jgi:two-component system chemotaxis response regulator CheB
MRTLCKLIDHLPFPFQAPILAVLHAAAEDSKSPVKMLGDCTVMPVSYGADGDMVEAGRVYLAPPDRHLIVTSPGVLGLAAGEKNHGSRPAADCLFESAARVYGPRVIGVVLAGNGADGKEGLRAINAAGGIGVLQEAEHAVYSYASPSVWRASQVRHADYCLPLDDIAELLRSLIDGNELRSD